MNEENPCIDTAMVFAAGLGTRLKPFTDTMPKALFPVGGMPLLGWQLRKLQAAGFRRAVVNVHHFAEKIEEYLAATDFGIATAVSHERDLLLETGGGILAAESLLGKAPFLVHNADILSDLDLRAFCRNHRSGRLATLLVSRRETSRYLLFDTDNRLVGWTNSATGELRSPYPDLQVDTCRKLAFAGVHVLSPRVFDVMREAGFSGRFSIIDFYLAVAAKEQIYGYCPAGLEVVDVGKPDAIARAEEFIKNHYQ